MANILIDREKYTMREKRSLLCMEIGLLLSALAIVFPYRYTIASDSILIKVITIGYVVMAFLLSIVIMLGIFNNQKIDPMARKENLLKELQEEAQKKKAVQYYLRITTQCSQLTEKCALVKECLVNNFGDDGQTGTLEDLIKKYEAVFYHNIDKSLRRLCLIDSAKTINYYSIDDLVKNDMWETATLKRGTELEQEEFELYLSHIAELHRLYNENGRIVNEIDKLLIELTSLNDSSKENDLNELKDYISALQKLNSQMCEDEELEKIMMKY